CRAVPIPRSGGIYVFGTRSMWPPLAFTLSFCEASAWIFYSAFGAYYIAQIGVAPLFTAVGILTNSSGIESFGTDLARRGAPVPSLPPARPLSAGLIATR